MSLTDTYSLLDLGQPTLAGAGLAALYLGLLAEVVPLHAAGNPVRTFHCWFCGICAFWVLWKLPGTARYHQWFDSSGLALAERRGLGHKGMPPFGFFTPPKLPPALFKPVGLALAGALGLAASGLFAPRLCTAAAFCLYMLYYTQVFAEACAGGHGTVKSARRRNDSAAAQLISVACGLTAQVLIPSILFILACAPHLEADYAAGGRSATGPWPLLLLKMQIASGQSIAPQQNTTAAAVARTKLPCLLFPVPIAAGANRYGGAGGGGGNGVQATARPGC